MSNIKTLSDYEYGVDNFSVIDNNPIALAIMRKLVNKVYPLMKQYKLKVTKLIEMPHVEETQDRLGQNCNKGNEISIKLTDPITNNYISEQNLVNTLLHELVHNTYHWHDEKFYKLLHEYKAFYKKFQDSGCYGGNTYSTTSTKTISKRTNRFYGSGKLGGDTTTVVKKRPTSVIIKNEARKAVVIKKYMNKIDNIDLNKLNNAEKHKLNEALNKALDGSCFDLFYHYHVDQIFPKK